MRELAGQAHALGDADAKVQAQLREWRDQGKARRRRQGDASLWTGADEDRSLGWLQAVAGWRQQREPLQDLVDRVRRAGFQHALG